MAAGATPQRLPPNNTSTPNTLSPLPCLFSCRAVLCCAAPRRVIMLVQAGAPVDSTIDKLLEFMEPGDIIIDGGNEW